VQAPREPGWFPRVTGATFIDTSSWFCDLKLRCPMFAAGIPMRWDRIHLTEPYSRMLGSELATSILGSTTLAASG
jgi:hypothetical protein